MSRANPQIQNFSRDLIAHETKGIKSSDTKALAAVYAWEKLRPYLATLMGNTGSRSLLSRALALASEDVRWLRAVHVSVDGSLAGWHELEPSADPDELDKGGVVLVARLLELLVAFIGENLTLRMVRDVWPKLPFDLDFGKGETK